MCKLQNKFHIRLFFYKDRIVILFVSSRLVLFEMKVLKGFSLCFVLETYNKPFFDFLMFGLSRV